LRALEGKRIGAVGARDQFFLWTARSSERPASLDSSGTAFDQE